HRRESLGDPQLLLRATAGSDEDAPPSARSEGAGLQTDVVARGERGLRNRPRRARDPLSLPFRYFVEIRNHDQRRVSVYRSVARSHRPMTSRSVGRHRYTSMSDIDAVTYGTTGEELMDEIAVSPPGGEPAGTGPALRLPAEGPLLPAQQSLQRHERRQSDDPVLGRHSGPNDLEPQRVRSPQPDRSEIVNSPPLDANID